jgi:hypothetical protein
MTATLFHTAFVGSADQVAGYEVRLRPLRPLRPMHAVYVRRRMVVLLLIVGLVSVLGLTARTVLADRGGVPASALAIRPAQSVAVAAAADATPAPAPADRSYIVASGDTLWSIAEANHGATGFDEYVEALIDVNDGTSLQVGQLLLLP